jgi:hypothetical protein
MPVGIASWPSVPVVSLAVIVYLIIPGDESSYGRSPVTAVPGVPPSIHALFTSDVEYGLYHGGRMREADIMLSGPTTPEKIEALRAMGLRLDPLQPATEVAAPVEFLELLEARYASNPNILRSFGGRGDLAGLGALDGKEVYIYYSDGRSIATVFIYGRRYE